MPNVKMGADISSFKSGIAAAKSEVKTLDQQMKMLDATLKAEGKSEQTLAMQTQTLNQRMAAQKNMANQAEAALKAMTKAGVDPASEAYQKMARDMLVAQTGMMETQAALNDLGNGAIQAAGGVEQLETGLNGISKKISLDQVISGIGRITDGLENAAKKAVSLGESLFENIMNAARWADDTATMAMMYGIDLDTYQRMQKLVVNGMDTSVEAILKSQSKLKKGIGDSSKTTMEALEELGIKTQAWGQISGQSGPSLITRDTVDLFWEAGQAIMKLNDAEQESKAQALFGKSWHELVPLFSQFKNAEEFSEALKSVNVNSEEEVNNLATLNDKMGELRGNLDTISREILAQFAPGLISLSDSMNSLLTSVMDYLKTEEGQAALKSMSESFSSLFDGLKNISAEDVIEKFRSVFDGIVSGFKWISENGETLLSVLEGIGAFWAGLKVSEGVLTLVKVIDGLKGLLGAGGAAAAGGGLGTGLSTWLMGGVSNMAGLLGNAALQNAVPGIGDWLMNQTDVGMWLRGTKTPGETWNEFTENFEKNKSTFAQDWQDNVLYKFFKENVENTVKFWDQFWKGNGPIYTPETAEEANWLPSYMKDIKPVVEVQPEAPEGSAADIAAQIGTVTVYVEPIVGDPVNNTDKRRRNAGIIPGYANGIAYVPDTRLAWLHQGEQVRPAREVTSRNYSSNLYVEKMYMGGGTDARGLADEMAAAQRRQASSYGN